MQLSDSIEEALNNQINHEMAAAYNYLAMAAHLDESNLSGFARWMKTQREEELDHARRLIDYLIDRGGSLDLAAVDKPATRYESVLEVFRTALTLEQANTQSIHELYRLAVEEQDYATQSFLKWFLDEQVEEEKIVEEAIGLLEHAGENASAVLVLNQQFGEPREAKG